MKSDEERERLNEATQEAIRCAYRVSNTLGHGFLEKVYENALAIELRDKGRLVVQQPHVEVLYLGHVVGEYRPDIVVDGGVVLEVKAVRALEECHVSQCLNYLRATGLALGLILNFGQSRLQFKRVVWNF